jgi:hypothetical protein
LDADELTEGVSTRDRGGEVEEEEEDGGRGDENGEEMRERGKD